MTSNVPVITIDGLAASGKGTVATSVSLKLGWNLLDSGLLYRVVAFLAAEHKLPYENEDPIVDLVKRTIRIKYSDTGVQANSINKTRKLQDSVVFVLSDAYQQKTVQWNGKDVTNIVRGNEISRGAAIVASSLPIRRVLVPKQQELRVEPGLVADGRDMGTIIFPDAQLKIFLEATLETRTRRRMAQLVAAGTDASLRDVRKSLEDRDASDSQRKVRPLEVAEDAIRLDSSDLSVEDTVEFVMHEARKRKII